MFSQQIGVPLKGLYRVTGLRRVQGLGFPKTGDTFLGLQNKDRVPTFKHNIK